MGAYLHIGFVSKAKTELGTGMTKEKFQKAIDDFYPIDLFDVTWVGNEATLTLKLEILEKELLSFAKDVYSDYFEERELRNLKSNLEFIDSIKDKANWEVLIEESDLYNPQLFENEVHEVFFADDEKLHISANFIKLGSEGKFFMEEDNNTLKFMEKCAQKSYSNYKMARTFRVLVY